jgi:hypothetical protein
VTEHDIERKIDEFFHPKRPERGDVDVHRVAHAVEDIDDQDERKQAEDIFSTPAGAALQKRAFDVLENAVLDAFGNLEPVLTFLSRYPTKPYTYEVSPYLFRGSRPSAVELKSFYEQVPEFDAAINLCEETPNGDLPTIQAAGLEGEIEDVHIGIVDMTRPSMGQVAELLEKLRELESRQVRAYMHCEAGKGRTGEMTACVRMAAMGWSMTDALREAKNFGCSVPTQIAFIEEVGTQLGDGRNAGSLNGYPLKPLGSERPTDEQLSLTLESVASKSANGR